jgi:hypothetical protein
VILKGIPVKWSTNFTGQARDPGFKGSSEMLKNYKELKDIAEIERMLKALIKSL